MAITSADIPAARLVASRFTRRASPPAKGFFSIGEYEAESLSREYRLSHDDDLARRRKVVGLCLLASGMMGVVALYQTGLVRRLPEPPIPGLDSMRVNRAPEAYQMLRTPDSLLGLASYGITAILAAAGGARRSRRHPWLSLLLGGKALFDAAQAAKLTWDQWARHRSFCIYCLTAAGATFAMLPLALRDAASGLHVLRK